MCSAGPGAPEKPEENDELTNKALSGQLGTAALERAKLAVKAKEKEKTKGLTESTRTMAEVAPKVADFTRGMRESMKKLELGPFSSRVQHWKTDVLGMENPKWVTYKAQADLLKTTLMRMHTGSRGGEKFLEHFGKLINENVNGPENMGAVLDVIESYAKRVAKMVAENGGKDIDLTNHSIEEMTAPVPDESNAATSASPTTGATTSTVGSEAAPAAPSAPQTLKDILDKYQPYR